MQNNSGDLCLLIGIYSFILFYLWFFLSYFLPLYTVCLHIYIDWNVCRLNAEKIPSLFAIYSFDHHQYHSFSTLIHARARYRLIFGNLSSFQDQFGQIVEKFSQLLREMVILERCKRFFNVLGDKRAWINQQKTRFCIVISFRYGHFSLGFIWIFWIFRSFFFQVLFRLSQKNVNKLKWKSHSPISKIVCCC